MNKTDREAIEWAIKKYWRSKTDAELAKGLHTTEEVVNGMRKELGLEIPKGSESLKEFARRYIMEMTEQDKKDFIKSLPADLVWRMAEGNPHSTEDTTVHHVLPTPIMALDAPETVPTAELPQKT